MRELHSAGPRALGHKLLDFSKLKNFFYRRSVLTNKIVIQGLDLSQIKTNFPFS